MRPIFEPQNPSFESEVRSSFKRQSAMRTLGVSVVEIGPGWVEFDLRRDENLTQQHGFIHAGVVAAALDSACGYAAFSLMPVGSAVLTAEYKINLLRPASADHFVVKGWVVKPGRTLTVSQGEATSSSDHSPIAVMTATIMTVDGRGIES